MSINPEKTIEGGDIAVSLVLDFDSQAADAYDHGLRGYNGWEFAKQSLEEMFATLYTDYATLSLQTDMVIKYMKADVGVSFSPAYEPEIMLNSAADARAFYEKQLSQERAAVFVVVLTIVGNPWKQVGHGTLWSQSALKDHMENSESMKSLKELLGRLGATGRTMDGVEIKP